MGHPNDISARKDEHLDLCATEEVEPGSHSTLLHCVKLVHCALPEAALSEVNLSTSLWGKTLAAPLMMTGMTGGSARAQEVNLQLAKVAERCQVAFGLGSQRAMLKAPELKSTFQVRKVAPTTVVLGNIGLWQAAELGKDGVRRLMDNVGADGMAVHLNAAQELTQPEGDRDFRNGYQTLEALAASLGNRLWVKETGCGISPQVARRLLSLGIQHIDVSGLGGTSWVAVERLRAAKTGPVRNTFSDWGIPTAAAVASVRHAVGEKAFLLASGGIRNGLEAAVAQALGADAVGMALPFFRAQQAGGVEAVYQAVQAVLHDWRQAYLLTGAQNLQQLREVPRVVTGELKDWLGAM